MEKMQFEKFVWLRKNLEIVSSEIWVGKACWCGGGNSKAYCGNMYLDAYNHQICKIRPYCSGLTEYDD